MAAEQHSIYQSRNFLPHKVIRYDFSNKITSNACKKGSGNVYWKENYIYIRKINITVERNLLMVVHIQLLK
jgi:hypothetical protein